jgi:hypothetical protein
LRVRSSSTRRENINSGVPVDVLDGQVYTA